MHWIFILIIFLICLLLFIFVLLHTIRKTFKKKIIQNKFTKKIQSSFSIVFQKNCFSLLQNNSSQLQCKDPPQMIIKMS